MKKTNCYILSLLMAAALTACSSDVDQGQQSPFTDLSPDGAVPVTFSVSDLRDITRAATSIVTFNANEKVKVFVKPNGASDYTQYDYKTAAGQSNVSLTLDKNYATNDATPPYFPAGTGTTVQAYAYYPAPAASAATFSVADNQTSDANYKASDLMYAEVRTITKGSSEGTNLQMNHLMAQLHLNVTGVGLTVNRVLVNAQRSVTFTPSAGTATATGTASDIVAATAAGDAYVCIPVQPINTVTIKVETGSEGDAATTATFTFTSTDDFEAGKSYPINLTVNATSLGTTTAISDWNGQQSVTYAPTGDLTIDPISEVTYNGSAYTPTLVVKKGDTTLTKDAANGYTCQWFNNTNAGTAVVLVLGQGTYAGSVAVGKFTIKKADATYTAPSAITGLTYTGEAQALANAGTSGHGTFAYCATQNGTYTTTIPTGTNAGSSYAVYWKLTGDDNHKDASGSLTGISIAKATPSVTAPTAKPSLLYTGSALELINAGSTTGGTLQYSLNQSTWYTDAASIKGTEAQEYTVYYKVVGNDNYNDVASASITASIITSPLAAVTSADIGKVVCAAGHLHDAKTAVPSGCTAVGVLGKVTSTGHGLIVALKNAADQTWNTINGWASITSYASTTLKLLPDNTARGSLSSYTDLGGYPVSNWCVGQKTDYEPIFVNLGSTTGDGDGKTYDSNVNAYFTSGSNGDAFDGLYWSATEYSSGNGWRFNAYYWDYGYKAATSRVRPLLAF